ncbi:bacillithiol system redox-active protein YtxJ [Paraflavisolibacter sp. H34]|uniref:bacillithiol system redox-active protein YtxJ n=1 Tax=Huijunlia imazamoxiresistens TaxID=3127457 RepID=UPI00301B03E6
MKWIHLTEDEQLKEIVARSGQKPQVIFKHSTRCSISSVALRRFQVDTPPEDIDFYYLDLFAHRNISNKVADVFKVRHQSPQVLLIKDGKCIYDESHLGISLEEILEKVESN